MLLAPTLRRPTSARPWARGQPITVIDIGSSKICCLIARGLAGGGFAVQGRGYQIADGIKSGEVVDAAAAEGAIRAVLHEAEQQAGETVREVTAVIGAGRLRSIHVRVERPLGGRAVGTEDVRTALARVREELTDPDFAALHIVPVEMAVDEGRPLRDPRGIVGQRLDLLVHAVVAGAPQVRALVGCLERCHVEVIGVVAAPLAAGLGVATEEEMERGCLVLDMGAGTIQLAHFAHGRLVYVDRLATGGDKIVGDIAWGLSTSRRAAERIMNLHGSVVWRDSDDGVRVPVPLVGDRDDEPSGEVSRSRLTFIIRARVEDMLKELVGRLAAAHEMLAPCPPRTVIVTGGAAQLDGMDEFAEELFGLPARLGRPMSQAGQIADTACCAAAAGGLVLRAADQPHVNWWEADKHLTITHGITRLKEWLRQNF